MLFYIRKIFIYISLLFSKGALSDKDIKRLLGQHIFIYPFKEENLKPSSYNLTASKCAFVMEDGVQKLIVRDDDIIIPAGKTAIIETAESIYVSKRITGTYHSRVKLVSKGLTPVATTLDPCFFGISAISLHNTTKDNIVIKVGSPIVTIVFYALKSQSTGLHDNMSGRVDDDIQLGIEKFYDFQDYNKTIRVIISKMNKSKNKFTSIIYNIEEDPVCEKCENCNDKEHCTYKLLKNVNKEKEERKKIIEELKAWKMQSWILNKESLIKQVKCQVRKDNNNKDILIYSIMIFIIGVILISVFIYFLIKDDKKQLSNVFTSLIECTIPTITLIIGIIINYKKKYEGQ